MPFLVYVSKTEKIRWRSKIKALDRRCNFFRQELPRRISLAYYRLVAKSISSQSFDNNFEPLEPDTIRKKKNSRYWIDSGNLLRAVSSMIPMRVKDTSDVTEYMVNLPKSVSYAKYPELGTGRIPARPVFGPTIDKLDTIVKKETGYFLRQISLEWRV